LREDINIVKKVCKELGITQKELAEMLDINPSAISNWVNNDIPKMAQLVLEQIIEIKDLKSKLKKVNDFKELLNSL
jgi:predicted transcriptional regulator